MNTHALPRHLRDLLACLRDLVAANADTSQLQGLTTHELRDLGLERNHSARANTDPLRHF